MLLPDERHKNEIESLVEAIRFFGQKGWVPATSSNFSIKLGDGHYAISISGRDKINFESTDLMRIDDHMQVLDDVADKPSAETGIHMMIYQKYKPHCVMHTHSVHATVLSMYQPESEVIKFHGYEILKGLAGITTHDHLEEVPVFDNSQDMVEFVAKNEDRLNSGHHSFLIRGHGVYTWGKSVAECKRHIEVLEFLFECRLKELSLK